MLKGLSPFSFLIPGLCPGKPNLTHPTPFFTYSETPGFMCVVSMHAHVPLQRVSVFWGREV